MLKRLLGRVLGVAVLVGVGVTLAVVTRPSSTQRSVAPRSAFPRLTGDWTYTYTHADGVAVTVAEMTRKGYRDLQKYGAGALGIFGGGQMVVRNHGH